MDIDTTQFFTKLLATARANLSYTQGTERDSGSVRQAAREALQEAHSSVSQPAFFAALDALGGQQAVLERLAQALQQSPLQYYVQHNFVRLDSSTHPGDSVTEAFVSAGPFGTEAGARQYAIAHWGAAEDITIHAHEPLSGMVPCTQCGLYVWPDEMAHHQAESH